LYYGAKYQFKMPPAGSELVQVMGLRR
jgi:hypothetical protein